MPEIELQLPIPLNHSVQKGDIAYYTSINSFVGGFQTQTIDTDIIKIGEIKDINFLDLDEDGNNETASLLCKIDASTTPPSPNVLDYLFFSKDREVNEASIVGYYGKFRFENNSRHEAELFTVACDIATSSK